MLETIIIGALAKLGMALIGLFMLFIALRVFDRLGRVNFRRSLNKIERHPIAAAVYFSARFLGVCFVLAVTLL